MRRDIKPWTDEQFLKYFVDGNVEKQDIISLTCEQLILYAFDRLLKTSSAIADCLVPLLSEEGHDFVCEKQKEMLSRLHKEGEIIQTVTDTLRIWLMEETGSFMDTQDIPSWTCEQLIRYTYDRLNQKLKVVASFLHILLDDDTYGFGSDEKKERLIYLQTTIEIIQIVTDRIGIWLSARDE